MAFEILTAIISYGAIAAVIYFLIFKVGMMYYRYFFYKMQGIPSIGLPLPIFGHLLELTRLFKNQNQLKYMALEQ